LNQIVVNYLDIYYHYIS